MCAVSRSPDRHSGATLCTAGMRIVTRRGGVPRIARTRRRRADNGKREAMHKAYVVGAGIMGAAVVAAAAFALLVFAGLYTVSPGVGKGHRAEALEQQPSSTTTLPSSPSDATDPPSQSDATAPVSPSTAAETGRSPLPSSNRVATPRTTVGAQVPARPPSNSSGSKQLSSTSSPPPSDAALVPSTPRGACSKGRKHGQPSMCSRT